MYDWLAELLAATTESSFALAGGGAAEEALDALERDYAVRLPPNYRAFMRRWDGGTAGRILLFSVERLRRQIENNYRFLPYPGALVLNDEQFGPYPAPYGLLYARKPVHFFPFDEPHSSDVWCFDTARTSGDEYPVCFYDHEIVSLEDIPPGAVSLVRGDAAGRVLRRPRQRRPVARG